MKTRVLITGGEAPGIYAGGRKVNTTLIGKRIEGAVGIGLFD
jgi:hypothetical protein